MNNEKKPFVDVFAHIPNEQILRNVSFWLNALMSRGIALDQAIATTPDTDAVPASTEDTE